MASEQRSLVTNLLLLGFCTAGIYGSYLTQGVVQERLTSSLYDGERFEAVETMNLFQAVVAFVWSALWLLLLGGFAPAGAPVWMYWKAAISNTVGPALGIAALRNINYPAQVLAKSCKMIPVMAVGTLLDGKRYSAGEYGSALLIAGWISVFALAKSSSKQLSRLAAPNAPLGYSLCLLNLALDGYTNASQDKLKSQFPATTTPQMMFSMNVWVSVYYSAYFFGASSSGGAGGAVSGGAPGVPAGHPVVLPVRRGGAELHLLHD